MTPPVRSAAWPAGEDLTLERAAGGDADAFDFLLRDRLPRLFRIARAILRDDSSARDVVQDACIHAWRELPRLRDPGAFDAWLSQIVVNGCRSTLRRQRRVAVREIMVDDVAALEETHRSPLASPTLGDQVVAAEAVRRAFARVGVDDRALLVLHYVDDRPLAEIAATLRTPVGTVKWRLSRARHALERALEAER